MAGIKLSPEDSEFSQPSRAPASTDLASVVSDDDRSVAADSWSIKSDYGSTMDDDQRHADAAEVLSSAVLGSADYSSDKEEPYVEVDNSMLGLQSHWDATYAGDFANFHVHGHAGEVWFGAEVMSVVASWTKNLCIDISQGCMPNLSDFKSKSFEQFEKDLARWRVLDVGIGNGLLLQELAKQGFSDLTGIDYSEGAINLAQNLADRDGFTSINFLVDDILETKLERQFQLVMDKGTLDAIGLHPDDPIKRIMYWDSISRLVAPGGILVITSCKSTKDELMQEVDAFNRRRLSSSQEPEIPKDQDAPRDYPPFKYPSHFQSDSTSVLGAVGSLVVTVAFLRGYKCSYTSILSNLFQWYSKTWLSVPRFKGLESLISRGSTPEIAMLGKDYFSVYNYRPKWGLVFTSRESNTGNGKKEAKVGGDGSTGKGSGTPCSGAGMMAAPGQAGECISREAFESNPKAYFADLHAKEKGSPKPNK